MKIHFNESYVGKKGRPGQVGGSAKKNETTPEIANTEIRKHSAFLWANRLNGDAYNSPQVRYDSGAGDFFVSPRNKPQEVLVRGNSIHELIQNFKKRKGWGYAYD